MEPTNDANDRVTARLRRPAWPAQPLSFAHIEGVPATLWSDDTPTEPSPIGAIIAAGFVRAQRFTCDLTPERWRIFDGHRLGSGSATIAIHAIDAAASTPLLLYWLFEHLAIVAELRRTLIDELGTRVVVALPDDVPSSWRKLLNQIGPIHWMSPRYPAGSWRLMPQVLRTSIEQTLTLDAIAAVDLAEARKTHAVATTRPVALEPEAGGVPALLRVHRGTALANITAAANISPDERWSSGPSLALHPCAGDTPIADGELCFFRDSIATPLASACVRCGECIEICPTRCDPVELLDAASHLGRRAARRAGLASCIDCGLCTHACPADIPLHSVIASLRHAFSATAEVPR